VGLGWGTRRQNEIGIHEAGTRRLRDKGAGPESTACPTSSVGSAGRNGGPLDAGDRARKTNTLRSEGGTTAWGWDVMIKSSRYRQYRLPGEGGRKFLCRFTAAGKRNSMMRCKKHAPSLHGKRFLLARVRGDT
jgi:hypothetical protein